MEVNPLFPRQKAMEEYGTRTPILARNRRAATFPVRYRRRRQSLLLRITRRTCWPSPDAPSGGNTVTKVTTLMTSSAHARTTAVQRNGVVGLPEIEHQGPHSEGIEAVNAAERAVG